MPVLVMYERVRRVLYGHRVERKGADPAAVRQIVMNLESMGLKRAAYRTDQEPSIVSLFRAAAAEWSGELVPEEAPKGDSDSNAVAETAVKVHQGLFRTHKIALERAIGEKIPDESPVMHWLVLWAAAMHRRYAIGRDK